MFRQMHYVAILSLMRSGSSEFTRDLSVTYNWTDVGEPFNFHPKNVKSSKANPVTFLADVARQRASHPHPLVFKLFAGHTTRSGLRSLANNDVCPIVLERTSIASRWCSLLKARQTHDWTGRKRYNCTRLPPKKFAAAHYRWYSLLNSKRLCGNADRLSIRSDASASELFRKI